MILISDKVNDFNKVLEKNKIVAILSKDQELYFGTINIAKVSFKVQKISKKDGNKEQKVEMGYSSFEGMVNDGWRIEEITYNPDKIKNIMKGRLKTQSRLSGNKTWLPLTFIQLYCNEKDDNKYRGQLDTKTLDKNSNLKNGLHEFFAQKIYEKLYVVVKKDEKNYQHELISKIKSLTLKLKKTNQTNPENDAYKEDTYEVACKIDKRIYQVYTPNGYLNDKEPLIVKNITNSISPDIVIDHVNPIDTTLSTIEFKDNGLKLISKVVRDTKKNDTSDNGTKLTGKTLEKTAYNNFKKGKENIIVKNLFEDLKNVIKDSHYRLVSSSMNSEKSNLMDYKEFYRVQDGTIDNYKYYAKIGEINRDEVIYQYLGKKTKKGIVIGDTYMKSMKEEDFNNIQKEAIKLVDVPIDLL